MAQDETFRTAYSAAFRQKGSTAVWTAEIAIKGHTGAVVQLKCNEDTSAVLVWDKTDYWEPLHGSTCTLEVESPGDRTLTGLYSVATGHIRLKLFCNGELYWTGTLEPEFYEEPYNAAKGYIVALTFADFGQLKRMDFDIKTPAKISVAQLLEYALERVQLDPTAVTELISTEHKGSALSLGDIYVQTANFYDEDGEALTVAEVLEGALRPLGLRLEQRNGTFLVYDLNALATQPSSPQMLPPTVAVYGNAVLSAAATTKDIELTFSPYDKKNYFDGDLDGDTLFADTDTTLTNHIYLDRDTSDRVRGFDFITGIPADTSRLPVRLMQGVAPAARYFRIVPEHSGQDCAGIAYHWVRGIDGTAVGESVLAVTKQTAALMGDALRLFSLPPVDVPAADSAASRLLNIALDLCVDGRYNFFETAAVENDEGASKRLSEQLCLLYIPVRIYLTDEAGNVTHYFHRPTDGAGGMGTWRWASDGRAPWGAMEFAWYSEDMKDKTSGVQSGFATNRPCVEAAPLKKLRRINTRRFRLRGEGETLPLPPAEGRLMVDIGRGIDFFDHEGSHENNADRVAEINWVLYKNPRISVVTSAFTEIDETDELISGTVDAEAANTVSVDTICGSCPGRITARGRMFLGDAPMDAVTRGPNTARPEVLLIASLASQMAVRHTVISGTCDFIKTASLLRRVQAQPSDRFFYLAAETATLRQGESEVTLVELSPDDYAAKFDITNG